VHDLEIVRHRDAAAFLAAAGGYLTRREAEHNLLLGICGRLGATPRLYGADPYFAAVSRGDEVVGAAVRTPPYNVLLSELAEPAAVEPIVEDVGSIFPDVPGVFGPKEASRRFAELWSERTGEPARLAMQVRIFRCRRVVSPPPVAGAPRRPGRPDRELLVDWLKAFMAEAMPDGTPRPAEEAVDDYLARPGIEGAYLWDDGRPASLAACGNPTPNGVRIGPVYTPPELRGRGYASALVAALTQLLLDSGRELCFLFTDIANPTSNKIYQRIGYEPVADVDEYRFSEG